MTPRNILITATLGASLCLHATSQQLIELRNGETADANDVNANFQLVNNNANAAAAAAQTAVANADQASAAAAVLAANVASLTGSLTINNGGNLAIGPGNAGSDPGQLFSARNNAGGFFTVLRDSDPTFQGVQLITRCKAPPGSGAQSRFENDNGRIDIGQDSSGNFVVQHDDTTRMIVERGGSVGIATTAPRTLLHVRRGTGGNRRAVALFESENCGSTCAQPSPTEQIRLWNSNTAGGQAGIGLTGGISAGDPNDLPNVYVGTGSGTESRHFVVESLQANGTLTRRLQVEPGGTCRNATGAWTTFSDARLKRDIAQIDGKDALASLLRLRGVTFRYTEEAQKDSIVPAGIRRGFVAQDVEFVFPDWVSEDENGIKSVTETGVTALAVEALRELETRNQLLLQQNNELQQRVAALEEMAVAMAELKRAMQPFLAGKR